MQREKFSQFWGISTKFELIIGKIFVKLGHDICMMDGPAWKETGVVQFELQETI